MATRRDGIANSRRRNRRLTAVGRTTHRGWGVTPTRPRHLLAVGLVVAVLANLVVRLTYGSLPGFPLLGGITLAVLGVAEAIGGRALRARIRREPHAAAPAPGSSRSRHRAGRAGHLRADRPRAGRHERGPRRGRGRGAVRAAPGRPGRGRIPVDRPLGARAAAPAAH